jgi:hypothetical protein
MAPPTWKEVLMSPDARPCSWSATPDAGLATRSICDHDRRGIWACVTDAGRAVQKEAEPTHREVLADTLER